MQRLSKEDWRLIKFGPQFYLPHEVLRHAELMKILEENGIEAKKIDDYIFENRDFDSRN